MMSEFKTRNGLSLERPCERCGESFAFKKYGSGHKWHYNRKQRFCSKQCADEAQRTGCIDKNGYVVGTRQGKHVTVHRKIMERYIGRPLLSHETVHHKNGIRNDNRIENLELWSNRHGKGQRVEDKIAFCRSFLNEYGFDVSAFPIPSDVPVNVVGLF